MVIPKTLISGSLNVGDVVVGNSSHGFLETVNEIRQEEVAKFVYTELTVCSKGSSSRKKYVLFFTIKNVVFLSIYIIGTGRL